MRYKSLDKKFEKYKKLMKGEVNSDKLEDIQPPLFAANAHSNDFWHKLFNTRTYE